MYKYVDLFAGCGGLSIGLERAGLELELAVEKSDMAAETFYHNFIERIADQEAWKKFAAESTPVTEQAKSKLVVKELQKVLDSDELVASLKAKDIDLIAGGPPCQGFSMAGRRNPDDVRNQLPWQFLELVERTQPKAVVIENVAGMRQNFAKHGGTEPVFNQVRRALIETKPGYVVQPVLLNAMHYGAPQHRPRVMLIGVRADVALLLGITAADDIWKSEYDKPGHPMADKHPHLAPLATFFGKDIRTVKDAIWDLDDTNYKTDSESKKYESEAGSYAKAVRSDISWVPQHLREHVKANLHNQLKRKHSDNVQSRFRLYQYLRDHDIPSKILNIPAKSDLPYEQQLSRVRENLENARFPAKAPDGTVIAHNLDDLCKLIVNLGTKKHSQRPLKLDAPSPTVVSLPDDFVHPTAPRTLTVRELARFQSFPDTFEFRSKETTGAHRRRVEVPQYTQVGNAVAPLMAEAVGKVIKDILDSYAKLSSKTKRSTQAHEQIFGESKEAA